MKYRGLCTILVGCVMLTSVFYISTNAVAVPSITIVNPPAGAIVAGVVTVQASVSANNWVRLYVDSTLVSSMVYNSGTGYYEYQLDTRGWADGNRLLQVVASNASGEAYAGRIVKFDNTPPTISDLRVIYPVSHGYLQKAVKNGDVIRIVANITESTSAVTTARADATSLGIGVVDMFDDGLHNDGSMNDNFYSTSFVTVSSTANDNKTIYISAADAARNSAQRSIVVRVDNIPPNVPVTYLVYPSAQTAAKNSDRIRVLTDFSRTYIRGYADIVFVIDDSGSMSWNDPNNIRVSAAQRFVQRGMMEGDRGAVVIFTHTAEYSPRGSTDHHLDSPGHSHPFDCLINTCLASSNFLSSGGTSYNPALRLANDELINNGLPENSWVIIFLTDGEPSDTYDTEVARAAAAGIVIFTIGLNVAPGSTAETRLRDIASATGGEYYRAAAAIDIDPAYENISRRIVRQVAAPPEDIAFAIANVTSLGGPREVMMYNDGLHDDGTATDFVFATDLITVRCSATDNQNVSVLGMDTAGNVNESWIWIPVDNTPPEVSNINVNGVGGVPSPFKDGNLVIVSALVQDRGAVGGILKVYVDASEVGGGCAAMTGSPLGGNFVSQQIMISTGGATGVFHVWVNAIDHAGNNISQAGNIMIDNSNFVCTVLSPANREFVEGVYTFKVAVSERKVVRSVSLAITGPSSMTMEGLAYDSQTGEYKTTIDTKSLADGQYTVQATVNTIFGTSRTSGSISFNIDNTPPTLVVLKPKIGEYISGLYQMDLTGSSDVFQSYTRFKVDNGSWKISPPPNQWNIYPEFDTTTVSEGEHYITIQAVDKIGHISEAVIKVVVDNKNPTCTISAPGPGDYIEGEFTFKVLAADSVKVAYVELEVFGETCKLAYNSILDIYEYTVQTRTVQDGTYEVSATAYDASGKLYRAGPRTFYVDNTPPSLVIHSPTEGQFVHGVWNIELTAATKDEPAAFQWYTRFCIDDGHWEPPTLSWQTTLIWDTTKVSDGSHILTVQAADKIGHVAEKSIKVIVDNSAPTCTINAPGNREYIGGVYTFKVKASDELEVEKVLITLFNKSVYADTVEMSYNAAEDTFEYSVNTRRVPDGEYFADVVVYDISGKYYMLTRIFYVDNNVPRLDFITPSKIGEIIEGHYIIRVKCEDIFFGEFLKVECKIDELSPEEMIGDLTTWVWIYTWDTKNVADGVHTIQVISTDPAGRVNRTKMAVTVDNHAPNLALIEPVMPSPEVFITEEIFKVRGVFKVIVEATDEVGLKEVGPVKIMIDFGDPLNMSISPTGLNKYEYSIDTTLLESGRKHHFEVVAIDRLEHKATLERWFFVDNTPPGIFVEEPTNLTVPKLGAILIKVRVVDESGEEPTEVCIKINGGEWRPMERVPKKVGLYTYIWHTTAKDNGIHRIELKATDRLGNTKTSEIKLIVENNDYSWIIMVLLIVVYVVLITMFYLIRPKLKPFARLPAAYYPYGMPMARMPAARAPAPPVQPQPQPQPRPQPQQMKKGQIWYGGSITAKPEKKKGLFGR